MKKVYSYGVIPIKRVQGTLYLFIIKHRSYNNENGHWGFPKGRKEKDETSQQTAIRELKEETNLTFKSFIETPFNHVFSENYKVQYGKSLCQKHVVYYPCFVSGNAILQEEEVEEGKWIIVDDLVGYFQFKEQLEQLPFIKQLVLYLDNEKKSKI